MFARWLLLLCGCLLAGASQATTWYVKTNGNDSATGVDWDNAWRTISNGVGKAGVVAPDTILVSNGVYKLTAQISISKGITVQSLNGRDVTIVDGNYPTVTNRCFYLATAAAVVDGFTITNGVVSQYGGGVYANPGTVRNCTITGNSATNVIAGGYGGGVQLNGGAVSNCMIVGNAVVWLGGGVSIAAGMVQACTISVNRATSAADGCGGGVYLNGGILSNCMINGNTVAWFGSGVYLGNAGAVVKNCIISNNTATTRGGAVSFGYGTVQDCTIINNWAADWGGGVGYWASAAGVVSNCLIIGNSSAGGGGIMFYNSVGILDSCTIVSNVASSLGGGIYFVTPNTVKNCKIIANTSVNNSGGGVATAAGAVASTLRNCLIMLNKAPLAHGGGVYANAPYLLQNCTIVSNSCRDTYQGGGIYFGGAGNTSQNTIIYFNMGATAGASNYFNGSTVSYSNCCFAPALSGASTNYSTNNTVSNPLLVNLPDNCRLQQDSPCINAGLTQNWMTNAVDLDGRPRVRQDIVDIGAYEWFPKGTVLSFQ